MTTTETKVTTHMSYYKLRVTLIDNVSYEQVLNLVVRYSPDCYAGCYEVGKKAENPHTHWYLEYSGNAEAIRKAIRALGGKGNRIYSMKVLDEEKPVAYIAYLMKEGDFVSNGFTPELLQEAKEHDDQVKDEIKKKKEKRKSKYKRVISAYEKTREDKKIEVTFGEITEFVIDFFIQEQCNTSISTIESWTNTLCMKYLPEYRYELSAMIHKRLHL